MDKIAVAIVKLQMRNKLLKKFLDLRQEELSQPEINGILDEIGKNLKLIKILEQAREQ